MIICQKITLSSSRIDLKSVFIKIFFPANILAFQSRPIKCQHARLSYLCLGILFALCTKKKENKKFICHKISKFFVFIFIFHLPATQKKTKNIYLRFFLKFQCIFEKILIFSSPYKFSTFIKKFCFFFS